MAPSTCAWTAATALSAMAWANSSAFCAARARSAWRGLPSISNWLPPTVVEAAPLDVSAATAFTSTLRLPPTEAVWLPLMVFDNPMVILVV